MDNQQKIHHEILQFANKVEEYKAQGKHLFASSSFQTHSIPMLKILSEIAPETPIYFINTGFHFAETYQYKNQISKLYNLNIQEVSSPIDKKNQKNQNGEFCYISDQDHCCYMNKVLPIESLLNKYDVWINGVRSEQSEVRKSFSVEEWADERTLRYHPMLNWDKKMIWKYIYNHNVPFHPLDVEGYDSIGCEPCTGKSNLTGDHERGGRWQGMYKNECGLHTSLIVKS
jgi:phosphoadenosine phosphosulfate reductase